MLASRKPRLQTIQSAQEINQNYAEIIELLQLLEQKKKIQIPEEGKKNSKQKKQKISIKPIFLTIIIGFLFAWSLFKYICKQHIQIEFDHIKIDAKHYKDLSKSIDHAINLSHNFVASIENNGFLDMTIKTAGNNMPIAFQEKNLNAQHNHIALQNNYECAECMMNNPIKDLSLKTKINIQPKTNELKRKEISFFPMDNNRLDNDNRLLDDVKTYIADSVIDIEEKCIHQMLQHKIKVSTDTNCYAKLHDEQDIENLYSMVLGNESQLKIGDKNDISIEYHLDTKNYVIEIKSKSPDLCFKHEILLDIVNKISKNKNVKAYLKLTAKQLQIKKSYAEDILKEIILSSFKLLTNKFFILNGNANMIYNHISKNENLKYPSCSTFIKLDTFKQCVKYLNHKYQEHTRWLSKNIFGFIRIDPHSTVSTAICGMSTFNTLTPNEKKDVLILQSFANVIGFLNFEENLNNFDQCREIASSTSKHCIGMHTLMIEAYEEANPEFDSSKPMNGSNQPIFKLTRYLPDYRVDMILKSKSIGLSEVNNIKDFKDTLSNIYAKYVTVDPYSKESNNTLFPVTTLLEQNTMMLDQIILITDKILDKTTNRIKLPKFEEYWNYIIKKLICNLHGPVFKKIEDTKQLHQDEMHLNIYIHSHLKKINNIHISSNMNNAINKTFYVLSEQTKTWIGPIQSILKQKLTIQSINQLLNIYNQIHSTNISEIYSITDINHSILNKIQKIISEYIYIVHNNQARIDEDIAKNISMLYHLNLLIASIHKKRIEEFNIASIKDVGRISYANNLDLTKILLKDLNTIIQNNKKQSIAQFTQQTYKLLQQSQITKDINMINMPIDKLNGFKFYIKNYLDVIEHSLSNQNQELLEKINEIKEHDPYIIALPKLKCEDFMNAVKNQDNLCENNFLKKIDTYLEISNSNNIKNQNIVPFYFFVVGENAFPISGINAATYLDIGTKSASISPKLTSFINYLFYDNKTLYQNIKIHPVFALAIDHSVSTSTVITDSITLTNLYNQRTINNKNINDIQKLKNTTLSSLNKHMQSCHKINQDALHVKNLFEAIQEIKYT